MSAEMHVFRGVEDSNIGVVDRIRGVQDGIRGVRDHNVGVVDRYTGVPYRVERDIRGVQNRIPGVLDGSRGRWDLIRGVVDGTRGLQDGIRGVHVRIREVRDLIRRRIEDRIRASQDDLVIQESIASYKARFTPATNSFIHGLKKLTLDSLEAVIIEIPRCAICLEDFAESVEELITCLPCKHYFHVNCIVLCLEINHLCPLCRYSMPTLEAGETSTMATAN